MAEDFVPQDPTTPAPEPSAAPTDPTPTAPPTAAGPTAQPQPDDQK